MFIELNGAEIYSPYLGGAEAVIREAFKTARSLSPCILFFDEIEALVGKRSITSGMGSSSGGVQERVLSTFLNEMDGIEFSSRIIVAVRKSNYLISQISH